MREGHRRMEGGGGEENTVKINITILIPQLPLLCPLSPDIIVRLFIQFYLNCFLSVSEAAHETSSTEPDIGL